MHTRGVDSEPRIVGVAVALMRLVLNASWILRHGPASIVRGVDDLIGDVALRLCFVIAWRGHGGYLPHTHPRIRANLTAMHAMQHDAVLVCCSPEWYFACGMFCMI